LITATLNGVLKKLIQRGRLTVIYADGSQYDFGECEPGEPNVAIRLTTEKTPWLIALRPDRYLGEAYMDGHLLIEQGDLWDLLDLCGRNVKATTSAAQPIWRRIAKAAMRLIQQYNPERISRVNVAHHYDLSSELYRTTRTAISRRSPSSPSIDLPTRGRTFMDK